MDRVFETNTGYACIYNNCKNVSIEVLFYKFCKIINILHNAVYELRNKIPSHKWINIPGFILRSSNVYFFSLEKVIWSIAIAFSSSISMSAQLLWLVDATRVLCEFFTVRRARRHGNGRWAKPLSVYSIEFGKIIQGNIAGKNLLIEISVYVKFLRCTDIYSLTENNSYFCWLTLICLLSIIL